MVRLVGDGLRSDGEEALPSSKSVCSILPIAHHSRAGALRGSGLYNAPTGRAGFSPSYLARQVDVVSYAAKFMGLSETGGRGGVGAK